MKMRVAALVLLATPLTACASSHLLVEQPNRSSVRANNVTVQYDGSTTGVPEGSVAYTQRKIEDAFFGGGTPAFARGTDLTVRYRFLAYDQGSRLGRYMLGGLAGGEAHMTLEAEFVSPSGEVLARVRGNGEVSSGVFGGSHNSAIDKAVKEIRDYAVANFR